MNKKAMELSINMIVVMILGLAMLGVGISIFYSAYNQTVDVKERVDSQTEAQLNALLDTGEAIVVPLSSKDGERGDYVDFDLGVSNELDEPRTFFVYIRFDGATDSSVRLNPKEISEKSCRSFSGSGSEEEYCADSWILIPRESTSADVGFENDAFTLENNERMSIPIRIVLPRRVDTASGIQGLPSGQYVFDVDVYQDVGQTCTPSGSTCNPYFSKKKIYINVE